MFDLLKPSAIGLDIEAEKEYGNLTAVIDFYTDKHKPDINKSDIIIIGVPEERNAINNEGVAHGVDQIRKALLKLFPGNWNIQVADIGNVFVGESVEETYQNLIKVLSYLPSDINVIILGGSQDISLAITDLLDLNNKPYNVSVVDATIDSSFADNDLDNENYLTHIIAKENGRMQYLNVLGVQTYYNHPAKFSIFDQLYLDYIKMGELHDDIVEYEPELRDSEFISIDIRSIRQSDMPAQVESHPNGLTGLDICKLTRMSGISIKNRYLGIFEYNPLYDKNSTGANLIAQMIWYYIEGKNNYQLDYPNVKKKELLKFYLENDIIKLVFYKNPKTNRWWFSLPDLVAENNLFSCTERDYQQALESNLSKRIYRTIRKVTL